MTVARVTPVSYSAGTVAPEAMRRSRAPRVDAAPVPQQPPSLAPRRHTEAIANDGRRPSTLGRLAIAVLFVAAVASAIAVVQMRHDGRQSYIELRRLNVERDELNIEYGRLQLEQATWAEMSRVERIARDEFKMIRPDPTKITVVRR